MTIDRWQTPGSDADGLGMRSLTSGDGNLRIVVEDWPDCRRFEFTFRRVVAYRNILEEYRLSEPRPASATGRTTRVTDSGWLAELRAKEPLLDVHSPGCQHFVIETDDDVLDIITPEEPEIREVEPAPIEPLPGDAEPEPASGTGGYTKVREIESEDFSDLIGEDLSGVTFVRGYLQLQFNPPPQLNVYTPVAVRNGLLSATLGEAAFANLLIAQIGKFVRGIDYQPNQELEIRFEDDSTIAVSLRPEQLVRGEAIYAEMKDDKWFVI